MLLNTLTLILAVRSNSSSNFLEVSTFGFPNRNPRFFSNNGIHNITLSYFVVVSVGGNLFFYSPPMFMVLLHI